MHVIMLIFCLINIFEEINIMPIAAHLFETTGKYRKHRHRGRDNSSCNYTRITWITLQIT